MADQKEVQGLLTYYEKLFNENYSRPPKLNRYKHKWAFTDMLSDMSYATAKEVIEFYFKTGASGHTVEGLIYNYDTLLIAMEETKRDAVERKKLRDETRERVRRFREAYGSDEGSAVN